MDIKQLITGNPKTGFYPVTQDTITVIELNKSIMSLTNESSSEEIIAAFDNLESFQALIAEVRNPQNIYSGILVNETSEDKRVGKYEATIIANTDAETLHVRWVENDKIVTLSITNTDGTMSCIRNENNVGGGSGDETNILDDTFITLISNIASASKSDIFNYTLTEEEYNYIINCIGKKNILPSDGVYHMFTNVEINKINYENIKGIIIKFIDTPTENAMYSSSVFIAINTNKEVEVFIYNITGYSIDENKINIPSNYINCSKGSAPKIDTTTRTSFALYKVLSESEYTALGDTPLTDNVLYFVIPNA